MARATNERRPIMPGPCRPLEPSWHAEGLSQTRTPMATTIQSAAPARIQALCTPRTLALSISSTRSRSYIRVFSVAALVAMSRRIGDSIAYPTDLRRSVAAPRPPARDVRHAVVVRNLPGRPSPDLLSNPLRLGNSPRHRTFDKGRWGDGCQSRTIDGAEWRGCRG